MTAVPTLALHRRDGGGDAPGRAVVTHTHNDTLDGAAVLPGFTCPINDIFDT